MSRGKQPLTNNKEDNKMKFKMNGWIYEANEKMTYNIGYPEGRKGERVRINKRDFEQLIKERDAFKQPYENIQ